MFSILIADDESVIRKGIISILKRELTEPVAFYEADNGLTALDICKKNTPHLVITDIRMPYCNGLDFIQKLRQQQHAAEIIILSGYEDFTYAKKAISLGVKEYILKPVNKSEFLSIVQKRVNHLREQQKQNLAESAQSLVNRTMAKQHQWNLYKELLTATSPDAASAALIKLEQAAVFFTSPLYQCCLLDYCVNKQNKDYIDIAVQNIASEILETKRQPPCFFVPLHTGRAAFIFCGDTPDDLQKQTLYISQTIGFSIQKALNILLYIGIGNITHSTNRLYESYQQADIATLYKLYCNSPFTKEFDAIPTSSPADKILSSFTTTLSFQNQYHHFSLYRNNAPSKNTLQNLRQEYDALVQFLQAQDTAIFSRKTIKTSLLQPISQFWNFSSLLQSIEAILQNTFTKKTEPDDNSNPKLLASIVSYVKENATKDINLNIVAAHFNKTPSYISSLFKKSTGNGFNDYITNERVKIAKSLLSTSNIAIYQVAGLCGYPNAKYFSVVFKKMTGETPAEYRLNF